MKSNKINLSVIYIIGGKYNKDVYDKSLKSVDFADEKIFYEAGANITNFAEVRTKAAKKAKGEWILYLDQDEVVSNELASKLKEIIHSQRKAAYAIPRKNIIFGKELKHCGLWPDYVIRFFKKVDLVEWVGKLHEQPRLEVGVEHLDAFIIHYKHDNLSEMVDKTNIWSEVEAELLYESGHPPMNFWRFASAAFREFWQRMIMQKAFLDGTLGVIYALYQVYSRLISYSKLWELQLKNKKI